eukprot:TRINITY_DN35352_c0_g1_i1.p1 TRINITY_DN35352_c0_g1~~TRINITY_DN35352_c0_g1_i1.p1  ORF type:complete len:601 (+),score=106.10 TRINITY_DN35352_c0_g1_i1:38-1840(+)
MSSQPKRHARPRRSCLSLVLLLVAAAFVGFKAGNLQTFIPPVAARQWLSRRVVATLLPATVSSISDLNALAAPKDQDIVEPLTYCGGGFCSRFSLGGRQFRGVVDTGSPFLLVSTCEEGKDRGCQSYCQAWGCTTRDGGRPTGLEDTDEVFAAGAARTTWRNNDLEFGGTKLGSVTYGTILEVVSYGGNGGGTFLGLVKEKQARIRPTLLGQTKLRTLSIDLRQPGEETLRLSQGPLARSSGMDEFVVPLKDLREAGASVRYYAMEVEGLRVAGEIMAFPGKIAAVIDTGTTGLGLPGAIFSRYDSLRRARAGEIGLRNAQAVDVLVKTEKGQRLTLSLTQGSQKAYSGDRFDIVTALPEPSGMDPDASALWSGKGPEGAERMQLHNGGSVALSSDTSAQGSGPGWAQADRFISTGESFVVRILPSPGESLKNSQKCDAAVGLAPRGSRVRGVEDALAYASESHGNGSQTAVDQNNTILGSLSPGDTVECGLTNDQTDNVFWRINGGPPTVSKYPLDTDQMVYPTVEIGSGCGGVQILRLPASGGNGMMDDGPPRWAEVPEKKGNAGKDGAGQNVIFLGLGFLLGRSVSIDTESNRVLFS